MEVTKRRDTVLERRRFLRFLAGSPLLAQGAVGAAMAALARRASAETPGFPSLIESPGEALSVFDFEAVAARTVPPAHFGFLQTGVDGEPPLRATRSAFAALYLRPRVLAGSPQVDTRTELFGQSWETPSAPSTRRENWPARVPRASSATSRSFRR